MAKQTPWDEQTDMFIADLDANISKKYSLTLRSLLMNPDRYLNKKGVIDTVNAMKKEIDSYFSDLLDGMEDEQQKLETEMEGASEQYTQIDSIISNKSSISRVPYVKPLFISRNANSEEVIVIERYSEDLDSLIGKLINGSSYVADISATYKKYQLGSWLFSGAKNYVLTLNPPISPVLAIENGKNTIDSILDDLVNRASG
ncbi:MAG: hypothetical protein ABSD68_00860 [Candidatus Micrarchaeales archaeon]